MRQHVLTEALAGVFPEDFSQAHSLLYKQRQCLLHAHAAHEHAAELPEGGHEPVVLPVQVDSPLVEEGEPFTLGRIELFEHS